MAPNWKEICDEFFLDEEEGRFGVSMLMERLEEYPGIFLELWNCVFEGQGQIASDGYVVDKHKALKMLLKLASSMDQYCLTFFTTKDFSFHCRLYQATIESLGQEWIKEANEVLTEINRQRASSGVANEHFSGAMGVETTAVHASSDMADQDLIFYAMGVKQTPLRIRDQPCSPEAGNSPVPSPATKRPRTADRRPRTAGKQEVQEGTSAPNCDPGDPVLRFNIQIGNLKWIFGRIEDMVFAAATQRGDLAKLRIYLTMLNPKGKGAKVVQNENVDVEEFQQLLAASYLPQVTADHCEKYEATRWFAATLAKCAASLGAEEDSVTQPSLKELASRLVHPVSSHPASRSGGFMRAYERMLQEAGPAQVLAVNSAAMISDIMECLGTTLASPDPQVMGTAAASNLDPHQEAANEQAVATSSKASQAGPAGDDGLRMFLHKLFRLVTVLEGRDREAAAHVFLILQDHRPDQSLDLSEVAGDLSSDAQLRGFLEEGLVADPGPWMLELGLRLRGALRGRPGLVVMLPGDSALASLHDDLAFLLAATLRDLGGPLSQVATSVLVSRAQGGWAGSLLFSNLDGLSHFPQMHGIMARLATVLGQAPADQLPDVAGKAELMKVLLLGWEEERPARDQRDVALMPRSTRETRDVALMAGIWLMACEACIKHEHVTDEEQQASEEKTITCVVRSYLEMSAREGLTDVEVDAWGCWWFVEVLNSSKHFLYSMSMTVAAAACLWLVRPSRSSVRLVLGMASRVLDYFATCDRRVHPWAEEAMAHTAVVEAVLGLLTGGRPQLPVPDPQVVQVLRGMPGLVRALEELCTDPKGREEMSRAAAAAWQVLQHIGFGSGFL